MGPASYKRCVIDRNVIVRRMTVLLDVNLNHIEYVSVLHEQSFQLSLMGHTFETQCTRSMIQHG
jgi:hypothetical protein